MKNIKEKKSEPKYSIPVIFWTQFSLLKRGKDETGGNIAVLTGNRGNRRTARSADGTWRACDIQYETGERS